MNSHLRKDLLSKSWVIVSDERSARPNEYIEKKIKCPFCPGNEEETPPQIYSLKNKNSWYIRVIPNKYPALKKETQKAKESEGIFTKNFENGIHEVIVEDQNHTTKLHEISHLDKVVEVYTLRMKELYKFKNSKYVMLFRNYGENAGASLIHPHSQILTLPLLPLRVEDELNHFKQYYRKKRKCILCEIIKNEIKLEKRVIYKNKSFVVFAPFASRFNFELWIVPFKHQQNFFSNKEFSHLADALKYTFSKLHYSIENLSYNMIFHTAPRNETHFHWHIEILPKLAMPAGFEWGSGFYINSISPEKAAEILKSGKKFNYV